MKEYTYCGVKARRFGGWSELCTYSDTVEGVQQEIDEANERAVSNGYKASKYQIVSVEVKTQYDDSNVFVSRVTTETVVSVYPEQV